MQTLVQLLVDALLDVLVLDFLSAFQVRVAYALQVESGHVFLVSDAVKVLSVDLSSLGNVSLAV